MLARLIFALLLAAFAVPSAAATSACHDGATAMMMTTARQPTPAAPEQKAIAAHSCIGCIPPSAWYAARLSVPLLAPSAVLMEGISPLALRETGPPALPPPRIG